MRERCIIFIIEDSQWIPDTTVFTACVAAFVLQLRELALHRPTNVHIGAEEAGLQGDDGEEEDGEEDDDATGDDVEEEEEDDEEEVTRTI